MGDELRPRQVDMTAIQEFFESKRGQRCRKVTPEFFAKVTTNPPMHTTLADPGSDVCFLWEKSFRAIYRDGCIAHSPHETKRRSHYPASDHPPGSTSANHIMKMRTGFSSLERFRTLAGILRCYFVAEPAYANIRSAMLCCCCSFRLKANRSRRLTNLPGLFCNHFFFCSLLHCLQYVFRPSFLVLST